MTDDFKPVSETTPIDPLPFDEERDSGVEASDSETVYHPTEEMPVADETGTAEGDWETQTPKQPIMARLRQIIWGNTGDIAERIRHLDEAIELAAETPANYVLRGELYFSAREYALARRDFQRAYELASAQFEQNDWGIIAQAMQDRALVGLKKAEKRLQANGDQTDHF